MKLLTIAIVSALLLSGCAEPELNSIRGFTQGTTYTISYASDPDVPTGRVQAAAQQTLDEIDQELSNYREDSGIEAFNAAAATDRLEVPPSLVELVEIANRVNRQSDGCYDLTVRPLFNLWGFGDEFRVPGDDEIAAVMAVVGMDKLTVEDQSHLSKQTPALAVDVSSIAQGYTTAQLAQALEAMGIEDYLVEVGGELLVKGGKPDGEPWRVAIERPLPGEREIQKVVAIEPGGPVSVVTSGTYRHYYDQNNRRYSHILDARTGEPVTHDLLSATVIHPDPTLADAWSTALLCMGTEAALAAAEKENLAVLLIEDAEGSLREVVSPAFASERWRLLDNPE